MPYFEFIFAVNVFILKNRFLCLKIKLWKFYEHFKCRFLKTFGRKNFRNFFVDNL